MDDAKTINDLKSAVIRQQISSPPADTQVPGWLWQIIRTGLSADPQDRYAKIESLLVDLDNDPEEEIRQLRMARKRKLSILSLIILTIVLPVGTWYGLDTERVRHAEMRLFLHSCQYPVIGV